MSISSAPRRPWLVAVWPGMGHVALTAGYYLMAKLGMRQFAEFSPDGLFDIDVAFVNNGVIQKPRWPRSRLFLWEGGDDQRNIIVFIGEAQPPQGKYAFCEKLIDFARDQNVERVFTFAAMATDMRPQHDGRVFAAATEPSLLDELLKSNVEVMQDGHVGGLNGVLLAAAAEKGMLGACLLGEMPHVFAQMLYPKPSLAVLRVFSQLASIEIDLAELAQQAEAIEHHLSEMLTRIHQKLEASESEPSSDEQATGDEWKTGGQLSGEDEQRIESLFTAARQDRTRAYELKSELDRLGVFDQYEDRFLDLFSSDE
jgi:uncharacterized protein